jgi:predicted CopG family antitoxin
MTNITLSVPDELHKRMKKHSEIRWSEVIRKSLAEKIADLEFMDKIASKNRLTPQDADEFANRMKTIAAQKFLRK